ncbi:hypothetical protein SAV14893_098340 [Streptomyces avermitilis]|uniref:Uncharacterized protein n=1 Tax=Streptomyces avermitilis TaxID=33903 RepID=A0A4D4MEP1_STRAX|nr:hypothetical protein [Streptomyces avermitilis]GDY70441.1 hypothetical protein SAV14893_098340 [Streptomyces avermitilis]
MRLAGGESTATQPLPSVHKEIPHDHHVRDAHGPQASDPDPHEAGQQPPRDHRLEAAPIDIDLLPGTESLVCPNCSRWCPITGHDGRNPKLVPHHTGRAGTAEPRRCDGSNRRVKLDLTIAEWRELLADAITEASSRQATAVLPKAFSPQTDRTLRARAERTLAGRVADWDAVLPRVADADKNRRAVPAGDAPTEGPAVPLTTLHPKRPER